MIFMGRKIKILHLEDLKSDVELINRELKRGNIDFENAVASDRAEFEKLLVEFSPDVILSDHSLPAFYSIEALALVNKLTA